MRRSTCTTRRLQSLPCTSSLQAQHGVTPGNTKKIYVLFFFTSVSIENNKSISFDILKETLKVYLSVAFLKTQKVFL